MVNRVDDTSCDLFSALVIDAKIENGGLSPYSGRGHFVSFRIVKGMHLSLLHPSPVHKKPVKYQRRIDSLFFVDNESSLKNNSKFKTC